MYLSNESNGQGGRFQLLLLNPYTISAGASRAQMETYLRRGRALRAEAIHRARQRSGGLLAEQLRRGFSALRARHAAHRSRSALERLRDHLLADIGIRRDQIPMVVQGLLTGAESAPGKPLPKAASEAPVCETWPLAA